MARLLDETLVDKFCDALDGWLQEFESVEILDMDDEEFADFQAMKWLEYRRAVRVLLYKARRRG